MNNKSLILHNIIEIMYFAINSNMDYNRALKEILDNPVYNRLLQETDGNGNTFYQLINNIFRGIEFCSYKEN